MEGLNEMAVGSQDWEFGNYGEKGIVARRR